MVRERKLSSLLAKKGTKNQESSTDFTDLKVLVELTVLLLA